VSTKSCTTHSGSLLRSKQAASQWQQVNCASFSIYSQSGDCFAAARRVAATAVVLAGCSLPGWLPAEKQRDRPAVLLVSQESRQAEGRACDEMVSYATSAQTARSGQPVRSVLGRIAARQQHGLYSAATSTPTWFCAICNLSIHAPHRSDGRPPGIC
jgi:hypothetical protein